MKKYEGRGICIDCGEAPSWQNRRCPKCSDKRFIVMLDRQNERMREFRAAKRAAAGPRMCVDGCGRPAVGRSPRCRPCRIVREKGYKVTWKMNKLAAITPP